jgi:hypothetical protein
MAPVLTRANSNHQWSPSEQGRGSSCGSKGACKYYRFSVLLPTASLVISDNSMVACSKFQLLQVERTFPPLADGAIEHLSQVLAIPVLILPSLPSSIFSPSRSSTLRQLGYSPSYASFRLIFLPISILKYHERYSSTCCP